jgi:hypothetical protein
LPIFQPDPGWAAALLGVSVKISKHLNTQREVGGVWNGISMFEVTSKLSETVQEGMIVR